MDYPNAIRTLSPAARRGLFLLALIVTLTSVRVQAAEASEVLPDVPAWLADAVETTQERGIVVAKRVDGVLPASAEKPKKVWNTVNAPDLETPVEYSSDAAVRTMVVATTAYNSEPGQTDATPFTTANGTRVRDGIVAANFLKFGTRIRIPEYFGDKVFEVHDRMNARYTQRVDIWMLQKSEALAWGVRRVKIEILP
ncbi:3D domain-containing protein [Candidatus Uhrbacteria bacterium]|nr:3D domain-containing protein [Candidatus Uhrbacteria bacterium]